MNGEREEGRKDGEGRRKIEVWENSEFDSYLSGEEKHKRGVVIHAMSRFVLCSRRTWRNGLAPIVFIYFFFQTSLGYVVQQGFFHLLLARLHFKNDLFGVFWDKGPCRLTRP